MGLWRRAGDLARWSDAPLEMADSEMRHRNFSSIRLEQISETI